MKGLTLKRQRKNLITFQELNVVKTEVRILRKSKLEKLQDHEANQFAYELLMPEKFILKDAKDYPDGFTDKDIKKLAKKYHVEQIRIVLRLVQLGVIKDFK